jgi:hypothetical protein
MVDQCEQLQEEYSKIFALFLSAAMYAWNNALEYLTKCMEYVEVRHSVLVQGLQEVNRIQGIRGRKHQSRVQTILDEHCTQVNQTLLLYVLKTFQQLTR